jgi:OmpA-OmpF porin, OOP family
MGVFMNSKSGPIVFATVLGLVTLSSACATKKFVRNMVHPLEAHLSKVDQKTDDNANQIKDVDARAERGISQAQQSAQTADQHAATAQDAAAKAADSAQTAQQMADNVDNYQGTKNVSVQFAFNSSKLTEADKQQLDQIAETVQPMKHYVIQIQGYTDSTGSKSYNLELSRRRADAVVRYLTEAHSIPLVRIYKLGYGEDSPAAPNKTRAGREENRRVQVSVMQAQMPNTTTAQAQPTPSTSVSQ